MINGILDVKLEKRVWETSWYDFLNKWLSKNLKNLSFRMSIYSAFCHKEVYSSSWTWKTQNVQDEKKAVKTSITKMIAR